MLWNVARRCLPLLCLLSLVAVGSRAAITVTGVTVAGTGAPYDVTYILNTPATDGKIEFLNASSQVVRTATLSGADLGRGTHHYLWDGKNDSNASVPSGQYTARVSASAAAVPAGGQKLWGPVDVNPSSSAPVRYGLAVNRNAGSPYFGRIYVCDYSGDTLHGYTADGTEVLTLTGLSGNPYNEFRAGIRDAFVGPDDRLYVMVQTDSSIPAVAGVLSMKQDGSDVVREVDTPDWQQPRGLYVTMQGGNKRFYFSASATSQTTGPMSIVLAIRDSTGFTNVMPILSNANDATAFAGLVDDIVVLDNYNDPTGHANSVTIYSRHNLVGTAGESTAIRWEGAGSDPTFAAFQRDATFNPGTLAFGRGLSRAPDGNLWTTLSGASTDTTRGYGKLDKTSGAQVGKVDVPAGDGKPRLNDNDHKGNVVALTVGEGTASNWAKYLLVYAPQDNGSNDATTSAAFTVSGTVLTPITISNLAVTDRTSTTATIEWDTDVASSSEVSYGPSATSLPNTATGPAGTHHAVTLSGLTKTTEYFFQVRSAATGFATATSEIQSFTTKDVVTLSNIQVTNVKQTSATISWTTTQAANKPTDSVVRYGTAPDALTQTATGNTDPVSHTVNLTGLTAGTTYYFIVQSWSNDVEVTSSDESFFATLSTTGVKVRKLSTPGDFKFGLANDVLILPEGLKLNYSGVPNLVNDAAVPDLPEGAANQAVVAYGGYLYNIAGRHPSVNKSTVYMARIKEDGSVDPWKETSPVTDDRYFIAHAGFGYNGFIYVVGGGDPTTLNTTLYAKQNPLDGSLGPWSVAGTFPEGTGNERDSGAVAVYKGRVYYTGGEDNTGTARTETYIADIKPDGTLSTWTLASEMMPEARLQHAAAFQNGKLYVWGGGDAIAAVQTPVLSILQTTPQDNPPGIAPWSPSGLGLTEGRIGFAGDIFHGKMLMVAGSDGASRTDRITYAPLAADGTVGAFTDSAAKYPAPLRDMDGAAWQDRFYVVGGRSSDTDPTYDANAQALATAVTFSDDGSYVTSGRYESAIIDLKAVEPLVDFVLDVTGNIALSYRIAGADGVFGPWTSVTGAQIHFGNATAQYLQFALDFSSNGAATPVVTAATLTYGTPVAVITRDDVIRALSIAGGLIQATNQDRNRLDVTGSAGITIEDAVALARSLSM